jgi:hypothetical protein
MQYRGQLMTLSKPTRKVKMSESVKPNQAQGSFQSSPDIRVPVVAAILMAGEIFRKGLKENEAAAVAARMVKVARVIVDEAGKS